MTYQFVRESEPLPGVRVLEMNRPDRLNAWNLEMRGEMRDALERAAEDADLRALVLTGAGRGFAAGEDVGGMQHLTDVGTRGFRTLARRAHDVFDLVESMEIPVIAAINGVAAGGGVELALSCDFRVMADSARMVMPEIRVGLIPGSGGCSRLVHHVGLARAKELVMLGEDVRPDRALAMGLATTVVPVGKSVEGALDLAQRLMAFAPLAVGMAKLVLNQCVNVDVETGRHLERLGQSVLKVTADHREGAAAFLEKRPPAWQAR